MKQKLLIFPLGGNGLEALDCLGDTYELAGFIDDASEKQGTHALGFDVFSRAAIARYPECQILAVQCSPASFKQRATVLNSLNVAPQRFATVVHPKATISPYATIGSNTLIMAGVTVTFNARIGNHCIILPNSVIHHDVIIEDYNFIGSLTTIAGGATIEPHCFIGSGSNLIQNICIGSQTMVGLGSNVTGSVSSGMVIGGNPAKSLIKNN